MAHIKSRLREAMEARNISIRKLSMAADVAIITILAARKDDGMARMSMSTLSRLASALDCRISDLFEEGGNHMDVRQKAFGNRVIQQLTTGG